jgi:hypothetical protein
VQATAPFFVQTAGGRLGATAVSFCFASMMCVRSFGGSKWWRVRPSRAGEFVLKFFMHRKFVLIFSIVALLISGCAQTQPNHTIPGTELKKIIQLDLKTNQPIKSWNAQADTIRQHFAPPVGITFKDADSGKTVHFDGSYRIESYQTSPNIR